MTYAQSSNSWRSWRLGGSINEAFWQCVSPDFVWRCLLVGLSHAEAQRRREEGENKDFCQRFHKNQSFRPIPNAHLSIIG
ncbi:hypothetical protein NIES22_54300 [Calothrix brevissima NIES-22]|nr:hypothetical protein NIES22_54300 [Calothrix brevissima NIES-22]